MRRGSVPFEHPWDEALVCEVANVIVGGTPSTAEPSFWDGEIRWMASGDVHQHHIFDVPGRISEKGLRWSNAVVVEPQAVAMALAGQGKTRATVALTHVPICTNQSVALIKPRDNQLDPEFLYQSLIPRYEEMRARSAGGGRAGLTKAILESLPIQFPRPHEQRRIAEILSTLDKAIEETEALIVKYQQIKAGLMHDLFTRGVTADGKLRPPREQAPELYQETPSGWIPKEWEVKPLGVLAEIVSGITLGAKGEISDEIEVPYLRVANVQDGYLDLTEVKTVRVSRSQLEKLQLKFGDVLMNEGGDFDKLGRGSVWQEEIKPCIHQNHVFRVRPRDGQLRSYFLAFWSQSEMGKKYFVLNSKQSTNLASINSTQLNRFPVAVPSSIEQERIETRIVALNGHVASLEQELSKLHQQKYGLMHDLLTGSVRVHEDIQLATVVL